MLTSPLALLREAHAPSLPVALPEHVADKAALVGVCRAIEARVSVAHPGDVVVACLQHRRYLTARTRRVYQRIAALGVPVVLVGEGLDAEDPDAWPGTVRFAGLTPEHPLRSSWIVAANTAQPYCFVAEERPTPAGTADGARAFSWATSETADVVGRVTATVLAHLL